MLSKEKTNAINNPLSDSLKAIAFPLFSIIVAIFVSVFFVMWAKGYGITEYFSALGDLFGTIWNGSFGDTRKTLETMVYVTPLIFTGIANAIAFKCGLFNIGVEGQFVMGMVSAAVIGLIPGLSPIVHIPLIIIGGIIAGAIWAGIPGYLKAKIGTNEVINTIMMNYLGLYLANYIILRSRFAVQGEANTPLIQKSAELLRFSNMSRANIALIIGILVAIFIYWLLWKTTVGYEIRAVGINPHGAEYGGINISKNIILAMVLSGAIAGVGGATHISGVLHQAQDMMALPGFGFDGIAVALLAKNNPVACIPSAILFGALNSSSKMLQLNGIPKEIVYLIQSIIIIFVATDYIVKYFSERKKRKVLING
ncbi:ABC transporter permease [Clostridium sp. OS1-26]|uniref:ABC transporter permease n=1 Tax=Clostridium sp. OS1-26 TaxID=3070681 RepID=UPI0027E0ECC2|nr:ABC transporter permease [Clostridium sp. OS1-26]WML33790.1 ABC transporter permease [Clostridium sp. OS1-26]